MAEPTTPVTPTPQVAPVQPSPVQEKKKGNGLKIVIIVLIVLLLLCVLCGGGSYFLIQRAASEVQTKVQNEIDKNGNTIKDQISNSVKDSVTDAIESAGSSAASSMVRKATLPVGFPTNSVILASDYEVITGSSDTEGTKKSYTVSYYSAKTVPQLLTIYKTDILANGWKLDSAYNIFVADTVMLSKSDATLSVVINGSFSSKEPRNMVTIVYQEK